MRTKTFVLVLAGVMIFSSFAVLASDLPVSTHSYNTNPAVSTAGYYYGNVTVQPDGKVTGTGSTPYPLTQVSSNVFALTENVNGTVTDQMNGSTINGNGLTVNGGSNTAVKAGKVTGITIENLAIVNITKAAAGIQLYSVYNSVLDNVEINNTNEVAMTMVWVYYSGNVTIENSNFLFGSTPRNSPGIDAEYDSAINVSFNSFSGCTENYFVYSYAVGQLNAWENNINSTSSFDSGGFYFFGGNAVFANNYINYANEAIYTYEGQSVTSMNNYISNSSYGLDVEYASTYTSYNDTAVFCSSPLYLDSLRNATVQYGNFSNSTSSASYSEIDDSNCVTVTDSTFSSTSSSYAIYAEDDTTLNLYNDQIILGNSSGVFGVEADDMAGFISLANDYVYAPNGYGLYVDYSPQFNVTNSYFNTTYGIYVDNYAVVSATISGNTFVGQDIYDAVYFEDSYDTYNFNFSNNTVQSPNSSWGECGLYLYADEISSNITVSNNIITNNHYPITLYDNYGTGSNAIVQNNTIVNSEDAIDVELYMNTVITGNKITNVSDEGIYAYGYYYPDVDVSYNLIENPVGVGMNYGIDVELFEGGNNIVSHNTVLNPGSSGKDIYVYECYPVLVYSNTVNGGYYGFEFQDNGLISFFGNAVSNADTGVYSLKNDNFSYYSNTINNANCSFTSFTDGGGSVFANTFSDSQANSPSLYFLDVEQNNEGITFYHNNFINSTTNSTTYNYFNNSNEPLFMNAPLPIGGNYYSNYTGSGTNGIGDTPMNLGGTLQDIYPLTSRWTTPTVTFIETGLASGTSWSASLGGVQKSSAGTSIMFSESNGQYMNVGYEIGSVAGYTLSISSGSIYQNGLSKTVTVAFTPLQYKVTFTESGLPNNTSWSVTLNGNTKTSSTGTLTINEANGTYSYSFASVNGYHLADSTGTLTVDGNQQTISMKFIPNTYTLTVIETGLPAGDHWNLTLGGQNYSTNSTVLTMQVTTGNYSFDVSVPVGYSVSPQSSNVTLNSNTTFFVHFSTQTNTPAVSSGTNKVVEGIGIGVLIMVIAGIVGSFLITGKFPWDLIRKR